MQRFFNLLAIAITTAIFAGCTPSETAESAPEDTGSAPAHNHPTDGPHHGSLVELGNEEYHAELLHDANSVTIYILDSSATKMVGITADSITINAVVEGSPQQFSLAATPQDTDAAGNCSCFHLESQPLVAALDDDAAQPRLSLTINDTPYSGSIVHSHAGHSHD